MVEESSPTAPSLRERLRQIEHALKVAELRYRRLAEATTDYIYTAQVEDGRVVGTRHGPGCVAVTGYSSEEFAADPFLWYRMVVAEDRPAVEEQARRILAGQANAIEHRITRKDGRVRWVRNTPVLDRGAAGELVGYDGLVQDVTERREAEQALRESEQRYRQLFDAGGDAVFVHELTPAGNPGRFIEVNDMACSRLGYSREELLAMSPADINAPWNMAGMAPILARYAAGQPATFERVHVSRSGEQIAVEIHARPFVFRGRPAVIALVRDISERKNTERALRMAQFALDHMADAGFWIDQNVRFFYVNQAACSSLGYTRDELLEMSVPDIAPDQPWEQWPARWAKLGEVGRLVYEARHRTKDGGIIPVEIIAQAVEFEGERFICAFARDITARKQAEQALRESEERLRAVVSNSEAIIFQLDSHGVFLLCEGRALRPLDLVPGQVVGASIFEVFRGSPELLSGVRQALGGEVISFTANIGEMTFDTTASPVLDPQGCVSSLVGIATDVTARRRAEEEKDRLQAQLVQAQKMEAVGRLAGGVAHDFNNLLTAILGFSELTLLDLDPHTDAAQNLVGIRSVVQQSQGLTRQILAFSRQQVLTMAILDLNSEVLSAGKMLRRIIGEDIEIRTVLEPNLGRVRADGSQLQQILLNLAVNARDAMLQGGTLTIATANVRLSEEALRGVPEARPGAYALLAVSDTGSGMDSVTLGRIFEPFFTTKQLGRGTGLGLATVYGIVRQHGGHVEVESTPGAGTVFKVYLPLVEREPTPEFAEDAPAGSVRGNETILVVEDEPLVREVTCRRLSACGYQVLSAEGPAEAIALAKGHRGPIAILVTDIVMPGMNGRELHARLSAERPGLRVLYMSGYPGDILADHGGVLDEGVHLIHKPFGMAELTRQIRKIVDANP